MIGALILDFDNKMLISDTTLRRVYQVSRSGELLRDFDSTGLKAILVENQQQYDYYKNMSRYALTFFVVCFSLTLMVAIVLERKTKRQRKTIAETGQVAFDGIDMAASLQEQQVDINDPAIKWIKPKTFFNKYFSLILLSLWVLSLVK